jgi:hypothetical protein
VRVMPAKPSKLSSDEYTLSGSPHNELDPGLLRKLTRHVDFTAEAFNSL